MLTLKVKTDFLVSIKALTAFCYQINGVSGVYAIIPESSKSVSCGGGGGGGLEDPHVLR